MKVGWGARHVLALLFLALVLVTVTGFLQIANVVRLALDGAQTEIELVSRTLLRQIGHVAREHPEDPLAALAQDPGVAATVDAAAAQAPSVVFVAVCDAEGNALVHTTHERVGSRVEPLPPLPKGGSLGETARLLMTLRRTPDVFASETPLLLGGTPFASIRVGIAGVFLRDRVQEALGRSLAVAGVEMLLAAALGFALARIATRRLRELGAGVAALREGRFDSPIPVSSVDEFGRLARDLNLLSEQFRRERQARDTSLGSYQRTVDLLGEGVLTLGADREVVLINEATARVLGFPAASARGKRLAELLPEGHPVRGLAERLYEGSEGSLSAALPRTEGGQAIVAVGHRITGDDRPEGVLIEFKESAALEELHSMWDQSRVLSRLGEMAAGVAHEIRNPLQAISFELSLLRGGRELTREEADKHVRMVAGEVQRLERAVSGFLKVARMRSLAPAPLAPNGLLEAVAAEMGLEANLSGLEIELDLDGGVGEIWGDREVLRQALQNLVKNAVQAQPSRDGRVVLSSRVAGGEVVLSVRDTGPGIPAENLPKVAKLYFTTKEGGTGVGLALARQAVEMHGGELEIQSIPGEATTMTIKLPLRAAPRPAETSDLSR